MEEQGEEEKGRGHGSWVKVTHCYLVYLVPAETIRSLFFIFTKEQFYFITPSSI